VAKISIYLDDNLAANLDKLVENNPNLIKRNRSELFNYLLKQEAIKQKRAAMVEAAAMVDELNLGWSEKEQNCAIIDAEVSG
jgi:metal-responsive CopG/Arc/MetJ family transcriptional regulator